MSKFRQAIRANLVSPIREFIRDSRAVGITLMACTVISLVLSNSAWGTAFVGFWEKEVHLPAGIALPHTLLHFINDGLMAVFFLLVGMEIKREIIEGELSSLKKSVLPILAATGGMLVPALLYYLLNAGGEFAHGWGCLWPPISPSPWVYFPCWAAARLCL